MRIFAYDPNGDIHAAGRNTNPRPLSIQEFGINGQRALFIREILCIIVADGDEIKKYPVLVFIHGESYEWNSGNPYDGTVLATFAGLVVVTINYRLGILGT